MLNKDPKKRLTIKQVSAHPYVSVDISKSAQLMVGSSLLSGLPPQKLIPSITPTMELTSKFFTRIVSREQVAVKFYKKEE
jgi:hypothetical protein